MSVPHDATVNMNVNSMVKALRDIALLNDRGSGYTSKNLTMLADRVEEMYFDQNKDDVIEGEVVSIDKDS